MLLIPQFSVIPWSPVLFAILVAAWSSFGWSFMAPQQSRLVVLAPQAQAVTLGRNAAIIYVGIAIGSGISATLLGWQGLPALGVAGGLVAIIAALHLWLSSRPAGAA